MHSITNTLNKNNNNMSTKPKQVQLTAKEAQYLRQRIFSKELTDTDKELLAGLVSFNLWLHEELSLAKLSIRKLKQLFGFRKEKKTPEKIPMM